MLFIQVITPLLYVSITPFDIYIQHLLFEMGCYWSAILIYINVRRRFSLKWKKAKQTELRVEDSVLLEGIGVLQGTLFIYLSLSEEFMLPSIHLNIVRWSIPLITILFYLLRGYGAIKDSSKHRRYSSLLLIYYLFFQTSLLFGAFISTNLPIYVNSHNIVRLYFPFSANLVFASFIFEILEALSTRYG